VRVCAVGSGGAAGEPRRRPRCVPISVAAANAAAAGWCGEVNAAVHSVIAAVPEKRLAVERDVLGRLPSLRCEIGAASVRRRLTGSPVCAMGPRATRCPPR
jgi:hypothetical protein